MNGILTFWAIDIKRIRKIISESVKVIEMCKMNELIKKDILKGYSKILNLLNKGKP